MNEIARLCSILAKQGVPFEHSGGGGITFWLGGNECWMNPTDDGGLYGGVGFLPWMCGHMKDAEHALSWCKRMLGMEVSDG
ncbi:MAG: hypothetical protein IJ092_13495 [Atopobiaceae bacterium]|nr:hypothetical protein [Atopobiaceae bacterium]